LPSGTFTGKSIFISGARYVGNKGLEHLGNVSFSGDISALTITENTYRVLTTNSNIQVTGDVIGSGTYSNIALTLVDSGVVAGTYGSADDEIVDRVPKITVDSKGRITHISNVALTQISNVSFNDTTISTTSSITLNSANNGNIVLNANGTGTVQIAGSNALWIPTGDTNTRPENPQSGYTRFNTDVDNIEFFTGTTWAVPGVSTVTSDTIIPDGTTDTYTLSGDTTTTGVLVSINGTVQQPTSAYSVLNNQITFTETPLQTDIIEVRAFAAGVSVTSLISGTTKVIVNSDTGSVRFVNTGVEHININESGALVIMTPNTSIATSETITTIDSYNSTIYRTAKYIIQATRSSNIESCEVLVTHDGTTSYSSTSGIINSGITLGTISTTISGLNVLLQYTATGANTSIRMSKSYIVI
jgi:hypothetical protein